MSLIRMSHVDFYMYDINQDICDFIIDYIAVSQYTISSNRETVRICINWNSLDYHVIYFSNGRETVEQKLNYPANSRNYMMEIVRMMRYINEFFMRKNGYSFFHAAAISVKGLPIILSGNKYSGKTTLILNLLNSDCFLGKEFISNDKLAIRCNNSGFDAFSSPISMGIRHSSYEIVKEKPEFDGIVIHKQGDKMGHLTTRQIQKLFHCKSSNYIGNVSTIFKPCFCNNNEFKKRTLDQEEKEVFFNQQRLNQLTDCPFDVENQGDFVLNKQDEANLSESIRVVEIVYGENNIEQVIETIKMEIGYE